MVKKYKFNYSAPAIVIQKKPPNPGGYDGERMVSL